MILAGPTEIKKNLVEEAAGGQTILHQTREDHEKVYKPEENPLRRLEPVG